MTPPTPAAPAPTPPASPPPPPEAKPTPESVQATLSWAELQKMQSEVAELRQLRAEAERKAKEAEERAIKNDIEHGRTKELMERLDAKTRADAERLQREYEARAAEIERNLKADAARIAAEKAAAENARNAIHQRAQRYALDGELGRTLSAHNLVPGGAEQLAHLWRGHFTVNEEGESFAVRAGTGQSVGEFVAAQLARPEYSHFIRSGSAHGGTAHPGANPSAAGPASPPPADPPPTPRNMGEAVILHMQQLQARQGDASMDMTLPMGLKAAR